MISALAVGYGVGMTAPDTTIREVRSAVTGGETAAPAAPRHAGPSQAWAGQGATSIHHHHYYHSGPGHYAPGARPPSASLRGDESSQLSKLRAQRVRGDQVCRLGEPNQSVARRATGEGDADTEDVYELDEAAKSALTRLHLPDFNVAVSHRALKYVRFLTRTKRGRGMFEAWLKRSGRYQDMIQQHLRERNLPEDLIWLAMIESGFNPRAKSPAGASGLWQFMRATGSVYGLKVTPEVDDRRNPEAATRAAAHHLRDLYQRFGDWALAMAAYNMGYEQLLERIDRYGTSDFNELARQRGLPKETTNYVPKIVAAALVANNLERYGFSDITPNKARHTAELTIPGGTHLKTLAKAAGVSRSVLRKLNPHLLRERAPTGRGYTVFVPPETLSRARASLPVMLEQAQSNALADADILAPDMVLGFDKTKRRRARHRGWDKEENLLRFLPKPKRRKAASAKRRALRDRLPTSTARTLEGVELQFAPRHKQREVVMYRVGAGDTLIGIAREFAIDIDDLARDNGLASDALLREGALLRLSVKRQVIEQRQKAKSTDEPKGEKSPSDKMSDSRVPETAEHAEVVKDDEKSG